jgi:hypothetical protein
VHGLDQKRRSGKETGKGAQEGEAAFLPEGEVDHHGVRDGSGDRRERRVGVLRFPADEEAVLLEKKMQPIPSPLSSVKSSRPSGKFGAERNQSKKKKVWSTSMACRSYATAPPYFREACRRCATE